MGKRYERSKRFQPGFLADKPRAVYERLFPLGARFKIHRSGRDIYQVEDWKGKMFVMNLGNPESYCECGNYDEYIDQRKLHIYPPQPMIEAKT